MNPGFVGISQNTLACCCGPSPSLLLPTGTLETRVSCQQKPCLLSGAAVPLVLSPPPRPSSFLFGLSLGDLSCFLAYSSVHQCLRTAFVSRFYPGKLQTYESTMGPLRPQHSAPPVFSLWMPHTLPADGYQRLSALMSSV